ncbi:MAG: HDOD domain-containing protein [Candidatus Hydrogenedentes bacterium]|nr:HDOD domain-containing protein [Candidatus Hydrogenedentota bacterium]
MKSILFVDDEPNILVGLERMLRPMRHSWTMKFVNGGQAALDFMEKEPIDVIVSDMRMPGMDGARLLSEVMQRYPRVVRIALSGHSGDETMLRLTGPIHQFLSKPCNPDVLKETVERAFSLRNLLQDDALIRLVSSFTALPVLPRSHTELIEELHAPDISVKMIARIIERDVGMAAKTLQWVNSAYFGVRNQVTSVTYAVSLLGLDVIRSMVLTMGVFSEFAKRRLAAGFSLETFMDHSVAVGASAKRVALQNGTNERLANDAFTAGILHDTGKLVLAAGRSDEYASLLARTGGDTSQIHDIEREVLGATHAEVGGYLLGLWGFPDPVVEAVAYHHNPAHCVARGITPLAIIHWTNSLVHQSESGAGSRGSGLIDEAYLEETKLRMTRPDLFEPRDSSLSPEANT